MYLKNVVYALIAFCCRKYIGINSRNRQQTALR